MAETTEQAKPRWYIAHVITGREKQTSENLRVRISMLDLDDRIEEVYVPLHEEEEEKNGKKKTVTRNVYPGYILVKMIMNDESWHAVRQTPGITGFIATQDETENRPIPVPLDDLEVERIKQMARLGGEMSKSGYKPGDRVRIKHGPFQDFLGIVQEVHDERAKLKVHVAFLGRETPVELKFNQVEES